MDFTIGWARKPCRVIYLIMSYEMGELHVLVTPPVVIVSRRILLVTSDRDGRVLRAWSMTSFHLLSRWMS